MIIDHNIITYPTFNEIGSIDTKNDFLKILSNQFVYPNTIMTRSFQAANKSIQKKRSSPHVTIKFSSASSQSTPLCLSGLFSNMSVSQPSTSRKLWGQIYSRTQRCFHLASLVEQHQHNSSSDTVKKMITASSSNGRNVLKPLTLNQCNDIDSFTSSPKNIKKKQTVKNKMSFPFMTNCGTDNDTLSLSTTSTVSTSSSSSASSSTNASVPESTSNWGFFIEADEEGDMCHHHPFSIHR